MLNIIRLRYLDTIEFLSTNSISAQTSMKISVGAELGSDAGDSLSVLLPELEYSDKPTITFSPQRGPKFARKLTAPVDIDTFAYLAASDWPIEYLLLLFGTELNGIHNKTGNSAENYAHLAKTLGYQQVQGNLLVGFIKKDLLLSEPIKRETLSGNDILSAVKSGYKYIQQGDKDTLYLAQTITQPMMWIRPADGIDENIKSLLHIDDNKYSPFEIISGSGLYRGDQKYSSVVLRTRSLLGSIVFLSQAVELPQEHIANKIAPKSWPYSLYRTKEIDQIFTIHTSKEKPQAALSVRYRGNWFYIDDKDMNSKRVFLIIAEIYRLAISEERPGQTPVLTLPVGG